MPVDPQERLMRLALGQARCAAEAGEVPVGALLVQGPLDAAKPRVLARAHNVTESRFDPAGHAEVQVIRRAAKKLGRWRLNDCSLVVTLEPCAMCAGLAVWARLKGVVFGAWDPKAGACGSVLNVAENPKLNHRLQVHGGILQDESAAMLREFFRSRRR